MKFVRASSILFVLLLLTFQLGETFPQLDRNDLDSRVEFLDTAGKYKLTWQKDLDTQNIFFLVEVETTGFVGFGISPNGGMKGSDIIIGGVYPNGTTYFSDRHGVGNQEPVIDDKENWNFEAASATATHTTLKFSRKLDTCDEQDIKIGNDTSNLIWAIGDTDAISYHFANRGSFAVNLLDPAMPELDPTATRWRVAIDIKMPVQDTTYWCSVHLGPEVTTKNHIIAFEPYLPLPVSKAHTHHFVVRECHAPEGVDLAPIMEPLRATDGGECDTGMFRQVQQYCRSYLFVWATGGRRAVFPDHVGFATGGNPTRDYYMLEIHYNNPKKLDLPSFPTGVDIFHTSKLRENEAGILTIGHDVNIKQLVPPRAPSFTIVGHCSHECTSASIPASGIKFFNVLLHSHLIGRKLKLRHYRDGKELPWTSNDDNYNFDFQQNRPLIDEILILPGDQFSYECVYDSTDRVNVTVGGQASTEEMCNTFIAYYPKIETRFCGSSIPQANLLGYLGIEGITNNLIVTAPPHLAGKHVIEVANEFGWTTTKIADLEKMSRFDEHEGSCSGKSLPAFTTSYLNVPVEYEPTDFCKARGKASLLHLTWHISLALTFTLPFFM